MYSTRVQECVHLVTTITRASLHTEQIGRYQISEKWGAGWLSQEIFVFGLSDILHLVHS